MNKAVSRPGGTAPGKAKLKETRVPQLTEHELNFCQEVIAGRKPKDAAVACGFPPTKADALLKRPRVVEYLRKHQEAFIAKIAEAEAKKVVARCPTRSELVNRLWEIANMRPLGVAESVTGQVAAAGKIADIMGFVQKGKEEDDLANYTEEELNQISLYGVDAEGRPRSAPSIN